MSEASPRTTGQKMVLFRGADAPSLAEAPMTTGRSHVKGESIEAFFDSAITADCSTVVPFRQGDPNGFSLVRLDLPPGAMLPRHSHSADCLYYIVSGGIIMGARELGSGDGFFVPAEQPYGYRAGFEGVALLEFRQSTAFDTRFHEPDPKRFREKAAASLAEAAEHLRAKAPSA